MGDLKISVIIPTYKRSDFLVRAIESVLKQTYSKIQIIVVDDNDPSSAYRVNTERIMDRYVEDDRVIYIKHDRNKNGAAARNTGIRESDGEIVCFLDDDDYFYEEKLEKQIGYLLSNLNFQGVYCGALSKGVEEIATLEGDLTKALLLMETSLYTPTLMFYRNVLLSINGFDESFKRHQDYEFLLRYFRKNTIGVVKECLVGLGDNDGSNQLSGIELENMKKNFLGSFEKEINAYGTSFKEEVLVKHYSLVFISHVKNKYYSRSALILKQLILINPLLFISSVLKRVTKYQKHKRYIKGKG